MRKIQHYKHSAIFILALGIVGVLMGVIGPVGTYGSMAAVDRYIYWVTIFVLNGIQAQVVIVFSARALPINRWPPAVPVTVGSVVCSLLATFEIIGLREIIPAAPSAPTVVFAETYLIVLIITLVVSSLFTLGPLRRFSMLKLPLTVEPVEDDEKPGKNVPFIARLSAPLGRELICLEMEGHYVRVHTSLGNDLILMRMRDAVNELENYDGMQVHRSFWVARDAIDSVHRSGERGIITMSNGMEIPVSRTRLRELLYQKLIEFDSNTRRLDD